MKGRGRRKSASFFFGSGMFLKGAAMAGEYIIEEIPEEIVKKYNLDDPGHTVGWSGQKFAKEKRTVTPFTGYEIFEKDDKFYVRIPKRGV